MGGIEREGGGGALDGPHTRPLRLKEAYLFRQDVCMHVCVQMVATYGGVDRYRR
jgi:hypothetical protein